MRAVIQRVRDASVAVEGRRVGAIDRGLLVYIGVAATDTPRDADYVARKVASVRAFEDENRKMNLAVSDLVRKSNERVGILAISQFTLYGDLRKGRRPSFNAAADPALALRLYGYLTDVWRALDLLVETGEFGAHMDVGYVNDGPVTLLIDSEDSR